MKLCLKVDVDTYAGTVNGIPRLLDVFARHGVRATFFFSLGPDSTGKAVKRVFAKGFVKKVLRSNPAASFGIRTMLYGTLLPAPDIGRKPDAVAAMWAVKAAGHELGIHAWDHVDWHDRLPSMGRAEVERIVGLEHARFLEIFGEPATTVAAPGWTATPLSVEAHEARGVRVSSDSRGGTPFHPLRSDGTPSSILEVPSTLPTLDELLALDAFGGSPAARERTGPHLLDLIRQGGGPAVHSIHTEIEGGKAMHALFQRQMALWKEAGVSFVTLGEIAAAVRDAPARALGWTFLPGRAIRVATGAERVSA